jgi:hypothetical protein
MWVCCLQDLDCYNLIIICHCNAVPLTRTRWSGTATPALDCYLPHMPGSRLLIPVPILCAQNIHQCISLNQTMKTL